MTKIRYGAIKSNFNGSRIITIGNFDGVHKGHQSILNYCVKTAVKLNLTSTLITFEPHPRTFFQVAPKQTSLQGLRDKATEVSVLGIDEILIVPFDRKLAEIHAKEFITNILVTFLNMKIIVVGKDFRFGKNRAGNIDLIKHLEKSLDFSLHMISDFIVDNQRISSSLLRKYAKKGDLGKVLKIRGTNLIIRGRVIHGKKLGVKLGFPTLNIKVPSNLCFSGIFIVKLTTINSSMLKTPIWGIASLGKRPTVETKGKLLLEVFLLDYDGDKYGSLVTIEFITKMRDEKKFNTVLDMKKQMTQDEQFTRKFIKING